MNKLQKKSLALSLFFTLVAMAFHYYLTQKYFGLKLGTAGGASACNINSFLNCDAVSASQYSSFMGRPLALWGLITNFIFLVLQTSVLFGWFSQAKKGETFTALFATFVAMASVTMATISLTLLAQVCLFCVATYILSWLSFGIILWVLKPKWSDFSTWFAELFTTGKTAFGFILAIPFLVWILNTAFLEQNGATANDIEQMAQTKVAAWQVAPQQAFDLNAGLTLGAENSPFTIVEFADFLCPHCKHAYPTLHAFAQAHPEVRLVYKVFPLDGSCNPDPAFEGHGDGVRCRLSLSTICAEKLEHKGWELHHAIFDHQEDLYRLGQASVVDEKICQLTGIDCEKLKSCMNSQDTLNELKTMAQEGIKAKITGTPSIFINGRQLEGAQIMPVLEAAYLTLHP